MENKHKVSNLVALVVILVIILGIIFYFFPHISPVQWGKSTDKIEMGKLEISDHTRFPESFPKDLVFGKNPKVMDVFTLKLKDNSQLIVKYSTELTQSQAFEAAESYFASHELAIHQNLSGVNFFRLVGESITISFNKNLKTAINSIEIYITTPNQ